MTPEVLGRALGEAPNPEMARVAVARLETLAVAREHLERPEVMPAAARLLGFSTAAADFFVAHPEEIGSLAEIAPRSAEELQREVRQDIAALGIEAGLRRFRRRASYRVAARDLAGALVEDVMGELTSVAEACLEAALEHADTAGEVAVIGMGKLGGRELNYSSDVDVIFVHRPLGGAAQERASRAASIVIDLLSGPTSDGIALRVDAALRPEGRAGALSRSLKAMVEYYGRHAETWERQAMVKARRVAGDQRLGADFVEAVAPLVYPASLAPGVIGDVRATKARIEERVRALGKDAIELKRGRGGIRDVEFAVQLLQLVHGRREPRLRNPGTLPALAALVDEGYVAPEDGRALADSYRFLRRLEHRLQMVRDLQTHELPRDPGALGPLARSMGLPDAASLLDEHARHTDIVRGLHERLFYRPLLEAFAGEAAPRPGIDQVATEELLAGLGFADPAAAYRAFARIVRPDTRLGKVLGTMFPVVAPALTLAAIPDTALVRFERVTDGLRSNDRLADALTDHPEATRRLASLVAASSAFADVLVANPDSVAALFELPAPERPLFAGRGGSEVLRIAGAYAARDLRVPDLGRRLAAVADDVIGDALAAESPAMPMAIVGLGKLGGEELSFGSDLDVMVVYEGEGPDDFRAAAGTAERVLERVRSAGWKIDPDLRPEGRNGPLARSLVSYLEYWERWAETWEFQSLLRARFVAGDEGLGHRFISNARDFAFPESLSFEQVVAIRRMRVRMEEERVRPAEARRYHFKLGYGSLADVQFAVELSLMRRGAAHPEVRRVHTLEALEALAAAGLLEASVALSLSEGYAFLMDVKAMLELEQRVAVDALPPSPEGITVLARRLGYEERPRHRFLEDYRRVTRNTRRAMERVFYDDEG